MDMGGLGERCQGTTIDTHHANRAAENRRRDGDLTITAQLGRYFPG
jgi:hypothetical protein